MRCVALNERGIEHTSSLAYLNVVQMVACVIWDHEVVGSNPTIQTIIPLSLMVEQRNLTPSEVVRIYQG